MPVWVPVATVAVLAVVAAVAFWKRSEAAERTLRSVADSIGAEDTNAELVRSLRDVMAEADLCRDRLDRFGAVLRGAPTGIALLSANGDFEYVNLKAEALLGSGDATAVLRVRAVALARRVSSSGESETVEVEAHDPDRKVLSLTAVPIGCSTGDPRSVALYLDDLSERRRVEAMRTDFVANASHELKTPLGALALLAETLAAARGEDVRARLSQRLQTEASRLGKVIDDVAQLAETQSLSSEFEDVSIGGVLEDAAASVDTLAHEKDITIVRGEVHDAVVSGDRTQLLSAIRNLLINAITYTTVKGENGTVTYRCLIDGPSVRIEVQDTGIGIPSHYTDRVFERFFRVDRARSRESGGTGLGLSIVRNVAISHGGSVKVTSQIGIGSTFVIWLPVARGGET